ncbi:RNA exonuclease 5 isoform X2 [Harmonia axyridis]|uniref:RNA exonuclease 5 isoform X2 n=1 Tax=Harmonia axyridis TaxID=115357 RepID=UPI001E278D00|nr:RNA exonuclease 5 isoform X2 [Harmonia axyridis]
MKITSSKRTQRIENKKKKMAALWEISQLNEYDRALKKKQKLEAVVTEINSIDIEVEPKPKRLRTELENIEENIEKPPLIGSSGKVKLSGEEFIALKKRLREQTSKMRQHPTFRLREIGDNASLKTDTENRIPLFLSDVQHLILYSQIGVHAPYSPARWCCLEKYNRLLNTNIFVIENLSMYHFSSYESSFQFLSSKFQHKLEVLSPFSYRGDIVKEISMVPITSTQMKKFINEYGNLESAVMKSEDLFDTVRNLFPIEEDLSNSENYDKELPPTDKFPRTQLLLSGWELVEENFPLPIKGLMENKYDGYVLTKDKYSEVTPLSPMFGIDCEMCKTSSGDLELTRISIVDEKLNVFYETLVKPHNKIVDYLTRYSGITPKLMKNVTTRLKDVQDALRKILPANAILVGQSLSNDLHALKMMHPYIIDTSIIFNITGDRTRKTRLQTLAREFLSEKIQESRKGHCSTEDSSASLKLAQLKLTKSITFGDAVLGGIENEFRCYPELGNRNYATSMLKQVTRMEKSASLTALEDICAKYKYYVDKGSEAKSDSKIKFFSESSNKDVVKKFCGAVLQQSLNIAHIRIPETQLDTKNATQTIKTVDQWIQDIYNHTAAPGLCIVIFGGQKDGGNACCFIQVRGNC